MTDYTSLQYTGERMIPGNVSSTMFWEHIYRYRFATRFVKNRRVLDIACGEGYGTSALLKSGARSVIGVDMSEEVIDHAIERYGDNFMRGNAEAIPLSSNSTDLIVSFETIEHLQRPDIFVGECARVLTVGGILIISSPNKEISKHNNIFHLNELTREQFSSLLERHFQKLKLFTQMPYYAPWWSLRSLAAFESPWKNVRGFCRLTNTIRDLGCPHIQNGYDGEYQKVPVDLILKRFSGLSSICNPFDVKKASRLNSEQPGYFIIIGEVRKLA